MTHTEPRRRGVLWTPEHRLTTAGLLLVITLLAFESMGVATATPAMVADLDGGDLYSWPFTTFLVASVAATVLSGRVCDRHGPAPSLLIAPWIFLAGLVAAGLAPTMGVLLAGRALQGFGTGALMVATSVLIALTYDDRDRPVIYAANAAAWVIPAVVGPSIAGLVTETVGWRWVFLGLVPLMLLGIGLLLPVVRRLPAHVADPSARRAGIPSAVAAALAVAALTWAAQHPSPAALAYGVPALVVVAVALRRLLPEGTLRGRPGLPTVVASRSLIGGAFAGMEAYLPLIMSEVHGYNAALAGLPLTVSALSWSAASAVQGRYLGWGRETLLRAGFAFVAVGLALFALLAWGDAPAWVAFAAAAFGGAGMGVGLPSISVLLLRLSPEAERGFNTSAMQLGDWISSALAIGAGGVLLALGGGATNPSAGITTLASALAAIAVLGVVLARRGLGVKAVEPSQP
ncbi:MFS transporter [Saccharomonospora xinjiangensis]|uniref:MFS transporter n=1 Tax=Saccharomonospora xinjiangensis TaxID=75294 RepID=UPI00107032BC|nr:MFS transporter [Saccharomonospora xinjiangensis]QBQ59318.1 Multidrug resistance protein 3 [Saccharomonospora xinjiangensis]